MLTELNFCERYCSTVSTAILNAKHFRVAKTRNQVATICLGHVFNRAFITITSCELVTYWF